MIRRIYRNVYNLVFGLSLNSVTRTFDKAISRLEKIESQLGIEIGEHRVAIAAHYVSLDEKKRQSDHANRIRARLNNLIAE